MKLADINILIIIFLVGCVSSREDAISTLVSPEDYNEGKVAVIAERVGLRPVDCLHYANNPLALHPSFEIFGLHSIPEGTAQEQLNALDAFQAKPCLIPPCNCGRGGHGWRGFKGRLKCLPFIGAREAGKHQERLEAIVEIQSISLANIQ